MSGTERTIHALLNHYSRIGFGRHLQSVAMEIIKKSKSRDPVLLFWRAYGLMLDCQYREVPHAWHLNAYIIIPSLHLCYAKTCFFLYNYNLQSSLPLSP